MRTTLTLAACLALLLLAPIALASCHGCLADAVDECGSLDASGCSDRSTHFVMHSPELAQEVARDPSATCDAIDGVDCP